MNLRDINIRRTPPVNAAASVSSSANTGSSRLSSDAPAAVTRHSPTALHSVSITKTQRASG